MADSTLTISVSIIARCKACGSRFDVSGLRDVIDADADIPVDVEIERCPECSPTDGGPEADVAAE